MAIALSSTRAYWSFGGATNQPAEAASVLLTGGDQQSFTNDSVWGIAVDNAAVYWSRAGLTGAIKRRSPPRTGAEVQLTAENLTEVRGIAVDSSAIYFSEYDGASNKGWIKKLAK